MELQGMRTFRSTAVREYVEPARKTQRSLPETPLAPTQDEFALSPEARAAMAPQLKKLTAPSPKKEKPQEKP